MQQLSHKVTGQSGPLANFGLAISMLCSTVHAQVAPPGASEGVAAELDEALAASDDARMLALVSHRPTYTLIRLDKVGTPQVRMDFYYGGRLPESRDALMSLAERFTFTGMEGGSTSRRDDPSDVDLEDWRTLVLPEVSTPLGKPEMTFFDRDVDVAIEFRPALQALTCKMSWTTQYHNYDHTGWLTASFYAWGVDAVTFAAQARRDKNTNPNLYLDRKVGSSWQHIQASTQGAWMDWVGGYNSSCGSNDYRLRVYMANEGYWSCLGVSFKAN